MPDNFKEAISRANQNFIDIVLPEVNKVLTGEFIIVENVMNNDIADILDQQSGIDALYVNDTGIRGVAIRIQYGQAWDTFTIRKSRESGARTEYLKRKESIEKNSVYLKKIQSGNTNAYVLYIFLILVALLLLVVI